MKKITSLLELTNAFPDDNSCRKYFEQIRWKGKSECPHCGHKEKIYRFKDGRLFKCGDCKKQFTVTVGTIFEGSHIALKKWFWAIFLFSSHKKGISSIQLSKDIKVQQKTAWFMLQRIRYMMSNKDFWKPLEGVVEVDETYIGGRESNKHKHKKSKNPQSSDNKTTVFGMLQRQKEIRVKVLKSPKAKHLIPPILRNVKPGSYIVTDQNSTYKRLRGYYLHVTINHEKGEYVRDATHINTLEGFWSHLKRMITGTYHHISEKHTHRYCDAMSFRYNTRHLDETERFNLTLSMCEGRLRYEELIAD